MNSQKSSPNPSSAAGFPPSITQPTPEGEGRIVGDYRLVREIGRGGMGVVFLARQLSLNRLVALKVLPSEFGSDSSRLERFQREAEVISRLDHPSIVPVYGVGADAGVHYIAMKFLDGETLDTAIKKRRAPPDHDEIVILSGSTDTLVLPARKPMAQGDERRRPPKDGQRDDLSDSDPGWIYRAMKIVEKVARALHHAHTRGVIHRDVKPCNIILDWNGDPWLLDFGLVRDLSSETLTEPDGFLGTAYYMAPELVGHDRKRADARSDIYSLGVTLYEALTLIRPFSHDSPATLFNAIANEEPLPPRRRNMRLPKDLDTVVLKAMSKEPSGRYQTAEDFAEDLRRVRNFEPIVARRASGFGRARKWVLRNPVLAGALLFAVLSFVGMVEYSVYRAQQDARRAMQAFRSAESAYEEGGFHEALQQYRLYVLLGGNEELVAHRIVAIERALAKLPLGGEPGDAR